MKKICVYGIMVISLFVTNITYSQCRTANFAKVSKATISVTSGDNEIDEEIATLVKRINNVLGTNSKYFFYDDSEAPNAYAASEDMNIYIGTTFLNQTLSSQSGMTGVAFLLAHELSHIYQFKNISGNKYMQEKSVKNSELQADFMAAYSISRIGLINSSTYNQMLAQAIEIGDAQFNSPDHHGINSERMSSAIWGFTVRESSLSKAYETSFTNCCPQNQDNSKLIYVIRYNNGKELYVVYGGAVCTNEKSGTYEKIGQMASTGNINMPFAFEFSHNPTENLYMDNNFIVYNYNGINVAKAIANKPLSNNTPQYEPQPTYQKPSYPELDKPYVYAKLEKPVIALSNFSGTWEGTENNDITVEQIGNTILKIKGDNFEIQASYAGLKKEDNYIFRGTIQGKNIYNDFDFIINDGPLLVDEGGLPQAKINAFNPEQESPIELSVSFKSVKMIKIHMPQFSCKKIDSDHWKFNLLGFSFWKLYSKKLGFFETE